MGPTGAARGRRAPNSLQAGKGNAMIQPEGHDPSMNVSAPAGRESAMGSPVVDPWFSRRALFLLGVLLVGSTIVLSSRGIPVPPPEPDGPLPSVVALPPREDREGVHANWTHAVPISPFRFTEIARQAGIDFVHVSGMTEAKHFPTAYGSGVAMFDYDNDGKLDLYFATVTFLPLGTVEQGPNRLYQNLGDNRFRDVTEASGLGYRGLLPRHRRRRHRQRRRPGRLPLQLRPERALSQ